MEVQEHLENIKDARHLREDEDAMAAGLTFAQELGEHLQLSAVVLEQGRIWERNLELDGRGSDCCRCGGGSLVSAGINLVRQVANDWQNRKPKLWR